MSKRLTLRVLLEEAVTHYGTQTAAAEKVGVDRSRFNKVFQGTAEYETFDLINCLRLARALGRPASDVLRAAGKAEDAQLIEQLYGPSHTPEVVPPNVLMEVSPDERDVIEALRMVKRDHKRNADA